LQAQGLEPKKAPPPDILRRLFGYTDPEPASAASSSAASSATAPENALPTTQSRASGGGAQFAEPVPGDFAYSGEQPRLAGRSTKAPTPRRVAAVSRGAVRGSGALRDSAGDIALQTSEAGRLPAPAVGQDDDAQSVSGNMSGLHRSDPMTSESSQDAGEQSFPSAASPSGQRGQYDIITGRYAKPQPGDFGYEAPPAAESHARPAGRTSVRSSGSAKRRRSRKDRPVVAGEFSHVELRADVLLRLRLTTGIIDLALHQAAELSVLRSPPCCGARIRARRAALQASCPQLAPLLSVASSHHDHP